MASSHNYLDFFAAPKPHHHVSRLLVLLIILALLILVGWLYTVVFSGAAAVSTVSQPMPTVARTGINIAALTAEINAPAPSTSVQPQVKSPAELAAEINKPAKSAAPKATPAPSYAELMQQINH